MAWDVSAYVSLSRNCLFLQIERTLFEDTVKTLNNYYAEAEKISGQSYLEGCLACVSAYIIFLCMETRYEKVSRCSSFYPFTPQSAVTIFLLRFLHIARFDETETSVIQSLQCFCKDWILVLTCYRYLIQVWPHMYSEEQTEIVYECTSKDVLMFDVLGSAMLTNASIYLQVHIVTPCWSACTCLPVAAPQFLSSVPWPALKGS